MAVQSAARRSVRNRPNRFRASSPRHVNLPEKRDDLAFYSVRELRRSSKPGRSLPKNSRAFISTGSNGTVEAECVITLTGSLALKQASRADPKSPRASIAARCTVFRTAKDLLASKAFARRGDCALHDQVFDSDATVIQRLADAGAVLVAKTTLGELAMADVVCGMTRNPWNLKQGSSGSSPVPLPHGGGLFAFGSAPRRWARCFAVRPLPAVTACAQRMAGPSRVGAMR